MQSKGVGEGRISQQRDVVRQEIRRLDHMNIFKARRNLLVRTQELRQFLEIIFSNDQSRVDQAMLGISQSINEPQFAGILLNLLKDYTSQFYKLLVSNLPSLRLTKLQILINLSTLETKILGTQTILLYVSNTLFGSSAPPLVIEYALTILRNMLVNPAYSEETLCQVLKGGWLRRILELSQRDKQLQGPVVWLFSVMLTAEVIHPYFKDRELELCLLWKMAVAVAVSQEPTDDDRVCCAYRTILEILSLNVSYCLKISKEELRVMVQQCSAQPSTSNFLLNLFVMYSSQPGLADRFVKLNGVSAALSLLSSNNLNSRKLCLLIIVNCLEALPHSIELKSLLTTLSFLSRSLYILEKDVQYIICDLLTVYTILVTSHNAEFTEELLESGILEIVVKRLISSIDATETQQIVQFIHSLQAKVQKKTAFALRLTKAGLRTTWNSANANYEFYGEIYKHPR